MEFKKTFWMNIALTVLWSAFAYFSISVTLSMQNWNFLDGVRIQRSEFELIKSIILFSCIIATPLVNSLSLKFNKCAKLNLLAKFGNWCAIGCTLIYFVVITHYQYPQIFTSIDIIVFPIMFLVFILPALITLKALVSNRSIKC